MLKIRRPLGRLIFNMGIAIPGKTVFLIETAPCSMQCNTASLLQNSHNTWHKIIHHQGEIKDPPVRDSFVSVSSDLCSISWPQLCCYIMTGYNKTQWFSGELCIQLLLCCVQVLTALQQSKHWHCGYHCQHLTVNVAFELTKTYISIIKWSTTKPSLCFWNILYILHDDI